MPDVCAHVCLPQIELVPQAARYGFLPSLILILVRAAGIAPKPARMILLKRSSLNQYRPFAAVVQENGKRPVKKP